MPADYYGGAAENAYRLCLGVARVGCEVQVLTTDADGPRRTTAVEHGRDILVAAGFRVRYAHRLPYITVTPGLRLRLLLETRKADVVHLTGCNPTIAMPTLFACAVLRKPMVWSPRGALQRWRGARWRIGPGVTATIGLRLAPRRIALHAVSEEERAACAARMPGIAVATIPNGVRIPPEPQREPGDGRLRIGFTGRLEPRKALDNLLAAAALLRAYGPAFSITIAASGEPRSQRELHARIARLGLGETVTIIDRVSGPARRRFFEHIDLFVLPSHFENFGTTVAEALARGVPVIASRGAPWRKLEERGCGLWVDNNPEALAAAIQRMSTMPLAEMGARGREWMRREFDWSNAARRMCNLYAALSQDRPLSLAETAIGISGT